MDCICHYPSPLGGITIASDGEALIGLWFDGQRFDRATLSSVPEERDLPVLAQAVQWLDLYFADTVPNFTPPLHLRGTPFRIAVWEYLLRIPYGQTTTYGAIAGYLTQQRGLTRLSAQAVGGAVGRNPISLIIPCHRVVGARGSLIGYAGGIDRKAALLRWERCERNGLVVPTGTTVFPTGLAH